MKRKTFLDRLIQKRYRGNREVRKILDDYETVERRRLTATGGQYLKGVRNGQYYRIKVPPPATKRFTMPKLYSPATSAPKQFKPVENLHQEATISASEAATITRTERTREFWERLKEWVIENKALLVLNFGSMCTLFGFTRSDVLELRSLSATGSMCAVMYHLLAPPVRFAPILWSSSFASINGFKIYQIIQERKGSVNLSEEQEERYVNFFLPHGVTPKQFQIIDEKAEQLFVKKGTCLVKSGNTLEHVYLVVSGTTRASILGRYLTAASMTSSSQTENKGGASGAWIGEMSLLEKMWLKEQENSPSAASFAKKKTSLNGVNGGNETKDEATTEETEAKEEEAKEEEKTPELKNSRSMYTIIAQDDCLVLRWSHADMQALMERSTDMRSALTRAMTAAIVGKVINFTVSRSSSARPTWSTWLDDWKYSAAAKVEVQRKNTPEHKEHDHDDDDDEEHARIQHEEKLPNFPIKRFK